MPETELNKKNEQPEPETGESPTELPDLWKTLKKRGHEIEEITPKQFRLTGGEHYYELDTSYPRSIVCTACPVRHGGILEAHKLSDYKLQDGILYFKQNPLNALPIDK